ncbi:sensor histidine kinase [Dactylosporangium sp. CS-047395]|uniref:sensor histidine kinase n=1 Tax=Dactylosporangium sp. CS-047395 TaxID=3239936 RepID=UPI003D8AC0A1
MWVSDLIAGLVLIGVGLWAWPARRATGALLALTGIGWFAGSVESVALYWHRGFLMHLLITYPGWRPRTGGAAAVVVIGYGLALSPIWHDDLAAIGLSSLFLLVMVTERARTGRRLRAVAQRAGIAFGGVVAAAAAARLLVPSGGAAVPVLLAYEAVLGVLAAGLAAGIRWRGGPAVTDLVVDLTEGRPGSLRDALARALGDPSLQFGYWQPSPGRYADWAGEPIAVPRGGAEQSVRFISRNAEPFAVLIHDPAALHDPALSAAVEAAIKLSASNATLNAQLRSLADEVAASRRRLVRAGDEEQRRLEQRLHTGPQWRLSRVRELLRTAGPGPQTGQAPALHRAQRQLEQAVEALTALGRGLYPRELDDGLAGALRALADRSGVPVRLRVPAGRFPAEVEAAAYFLCSEAVANVEKHAAASVAVIEIDERAGGLAIVVSDDGAGGADVARGRGIAGLVDRIEALGGRLTVESPRERGTRLVARIPLQHVS